ncbi:MBL fold metallo-hydrolase [Microlunatus aurantiacus]|uniref:MBL fold metallo-hydrolase n=1 Tax=Microlunatus aurantiacus TaxID=446786 RepID=A0ABP7CZ08_9ACTN
MRQRLGAARMRPVADDVHLVEHAFTNCYVIVDGDAVTLVDACYPSTWAVVRRGLAAIGRDVGDIAALVLTHGHFDHVGFARHLQRRLSVPVWVHEDDRRLAAHPYSYRPQRNRVLYPLAHPRSLPVLARMVAAGALRVPGVETTRTFRSGRLDVPGSLIAVPTPGHTDGHTAFLLPDRSALLTGDALVTLDPYTGRTGPRMVAPAATADLDLNRRSLDRIGEIAVATVLPGHGDPWLHGSASAVQLAHRADYG